MNLIKNDKHLRDSASAIDSLYNVKSYDDGESAIKVSEFTSTYTKRVVERSYSSHTLMGADQLIHMNDLYNNQKQLIGGYKTIPYTRKNHNLLSFEE